MTKSPTKLNIRQVQLDWPVKSKKVGIFTFLTILEYLLRISNSSHFNSTNHPYHISECKVTQVVASNSPAL